jgi:hypothetical protein
MNECIDLNSAAPAPADSAAFIEACPAGKSGRARTGKIARLPHDVREALNERLKQGLPASQILPWLNALPEVRAVLEKYFDGSPIIEQNLSRWRHGGYAGWFQNQVVKEAVTTMGAAGKGIKPAEREALTSQLALALSARMVSQLRQYDDMPEGPAKMATWKDLVWSLTLLRRGEFYAGKLRLEQEKLAPRQEEQKVEKAPLCEQEELERSRRIMGMGGPNWNNFEQRWEGEGAEEMTERDEVQRMVVAELFRRKAAKLKEQAGTPPSPAGPGSVLI